MTSKAMRGMGPQVPHLANKPGGLAGEIWDLRNDADGAFLRVETPGHGGTGVVAVDEWVNPLAADDDYVKTLVSCAATATTITAMTNATLPHARNLTCTFDVTGVGEGEVVITGTDINGDVIHEHFAVPAGDAVVTGTSAFKTVTSILLPALTVGMTGQDVKVGSGLSLGLGSKVKLRNTLAAVLVEMESGVPVGGAGVAATPTNQAATATGQSVAMAGHVRYVNPIAAELISISADALMANGARVLVGQPDFPRKLQIRITDADNSVTGDVNLVGVAPDGTAINETFALTGGTRTMTTFKAYQSLTSATIVGIAGAIAGDNMSIGVSADLGLPVPAAVATMAVYKTLVDDVNETVAGVDATAQSVAPTTAPNAAHDYDFYFRYTLVPVQNAHNHTQNAHSHGGTTPGTVSTSAAGLPNGLYTPTNAPNAARDYCLVYERDLA